MTTGYRKYIGAVTGQPGSMIAFLDNLLNIGGGGTYWQKVFAGTNKAVYRSTVGERCYLQVDDTTTYGARIRGFTSMSDVDTGTDMFPPSASHGNYCFWKSYSADAVPRVAFGISTSRCFWIIVETGYPGTPGRYFHFFGELHPVGEKGSRTALYGSHTDPTQQPSGGNFANGGSGPYGSNLFNYGTQATATGQYAFWFPTFPNGQPGASMSQFFSPGLTPQAGVAGPANGFGLTLFPVMLSGAKLAADSAYSYLRGRIPFVRVLGCASKGQGVNDGDTFTDENGVVWTQIFCGGSSQDFDNSYSAFVFMLDADSEYGGL